MSNTKLEILPYEPGHVALMTPQEAQARDTLVMDAPPAGLQADAMTVTADGVPMCCVGLMEIWPGRAYAWSLLSADAGQHMVAITRAMRFRLERTSFARIEMAVDASFEPGRRLALMLGFEQETPTPLRNYFPGGRDAWLFSRIR